MSSDIPVEILSTESREDGIYVEGRVPGRQLTRAEMNDILEREGLSVRVRENGAVGEDLNNIIPDPNDKQLASFEKEGGRLNLDASIFGSYPKVETVRGPSRDRGLSGKARRKARKSH